ncbi:RING-type E3 ubiquitin transferase [Trifolium repens]|nr:RING-type E3 ubiquitin transferase [Trifolium repens]
MSYNWASNSTNQKVPPSLTIILFLFLFFSLYLVLLLTLSFSLSLSLSLSRCFRLSLPSPSHPSPPQPLSPPPEPQSSSSQPIQSSSKSVVLLRGGMVMFCRAKRREKMIFLHVQQYCINCGVCMGEYFCGTCKFFDDDQRRKEINDYFKLLMIPIELMLCFETQFQTLLCGLIGLPPSNVVLPQSPMHTKSLCVYLQ